MLTAASSKLWFVHHLAKGAQGRFQNLQTDHGFMISWPNKLKAGSYKAGPQSPTVLYHFEYIFQTTLLSYCLTTQVTSQKCFADPGHPEVQPHSAIPIAPLDLWKSLFQSKELEQLGHGPQFAAGNSWCPTLLLTVFAGEPWGLKNVSRILQK